MGDELKPAWFKSDDVDVQRIKDALYVLQEHFDSVQILATRYEGESSDAGGTTLIELGVGNWAARFGQAKRWVALEEHRIKRESEDLSE
jgi:hypothetical protein